MWLIRRVRSQVGSNARMVGPARWQELLIVGGGTVMEVAVRRGARDSSAHERDRGGAGKEEELSRSSERASHCNIASPYNRR